MTKGLNITTATVQVSIFWLVLAVFNLVGACFQAGQMAWGYGSHWLFGMHMLLTGVCACYCLRKRA